jgi:hypothetical protein
MVMVEFARGIGMMGGGGGSARWRRRRMMRWWVIGSSSSSSRRIGWRTRMQRRSAGCGGIGRGGVGRREGTAHGCGGAGGCSRHGLREVMGSFDGVGADGGGFFGWGGAGGLGGGCARVVIVCYCSGGVASVINFDVYFLVDGSLGGFRERGGLAGFGRCGRGPLAGFGEVTVFLSAGAFFKVGEGFFVLSGDWAGFWFVDLEIFATDDALDGWGFRRFGRSRG